MRPLAHLMARAPARLRSKLLAGFGVIVLLLIAVGVLGVGVLGESDQRIQALERLQRKTTVYRGLQHDNLLLRQAVAAEGGGDIDRVAGAPAIPPSNEPVESTLNRLRDSYDFRRLGFVPTDDERARLGQIEATYERLVAVMSRAIGLDASGRTAEAQRVVADEGLPVAYELEAITDGLANEAEVDIVALVRANRDVFANSRQIVLTASAAAVALALVLGFAVASSLIGPVQRMDARLAEIAAGDFSRHVEVVNRDELGALAGNLNRMNDELGRLYRDLEAASRHKSEFLASMSHELRTPLNAIIGFSEVLREKMFGPLNERQADYLNDILTSGRHLLSLINDILDLSKIEAGKMELELTGFDLPAVLDGGLTMIRERAANHGISLGLDIDPDVGEITADERKVKQVVFNLLSNAVKFTPDGGRIELAARRSNGVVEVAVSDTGIGIAAADQERVFEEFQQAGQREGSGLGLALSRSFIELHGGSIRLESELGTGSTFTFTLPLHIAPSAGPEAAPVAPLPAAATAIAGDPDIAATGPTMLVIEFDERSAELLRIFLQDSGFTVTVAGDGDEGIEAARRLHPAAIILDLLLPHVSGWDVLTQLKEDPALADIPVVIVSMVDERGKGYALGAAGYLVKPVDRDELLGALRPLTGPGAIDGEPVTVLTIDDDPVALELVAAALGPEGYRVLRAQGGEEGLSLALREHPALVIVDLLMPGTDGFDVVEQLRSDPRTTEIPIVVLTAKTIGEADRERLNSRIAHLAEKGRFSRAEFVELVRRCCRTPVP